MRIWIVTTTEPYAIFGGVWASEEHAAAYVSAHPGQDLYVSGPHDVQGAEVVETPNGSYYRALPDWMDG